MYEHYVTFMGSDLLFRHVFSVVNCFLPSYDIALSVVSIRLFAPHKMAEIRPIVHGNGGVPNPRID